MSVGDAEAGLTLIAKGVARADFGGLPPVTEIRQDWLAKDPSRSLEMVALVALLAVGIVVATVALI